MTFGDYVKAIRQFITIGNQHQFIIDFFNAAGAANTTEITESNVKSWLRPNNSKGFRTCPIRDYFPDDKIVDENGFIKFLSSRVNTSWKKLQEAFRSINDDGIVDLQTDSQNVFYWSLLNQFQKIHGLPLSEKPTADTPTDAIPSRQMRKIFEQEHCDCRISEKPTADTPTDATPSRQMRKIFEQEYYDCRIDEFLTSNLLHGDDQGLLPWVDRFIETLKHDVIELYSNDKAEDGSSKTMYNNICKYTKTLREYKNSLVTHIYELAELRRQEFMSPRIYRSQIWLNDDKAASVDAAMRYLRGEVEIKSSISVDELLEYHRKKLNALYADICSADTE